MNANTFFTTKWYRDSLLKELGIPDDQKTFFNDLRMQVAKKHLGDFVDTVEFKKLWLQHEIEVIKFCIDRDQKNFNSQTKAQQKRSGLPADIIEFQAEMAELEKQLAVL